MQLPFSERFPDGPESISTESLRAADYIMRHVLTLDEIAIVIESTHDFAVISPDTEETLVTGVVVPSAATVMPAPEMTLASVG